MPQLSETSSTVRTSERKLMSNASKMGGRETRGTKKKSPRDLNKKYQSKEGILSLNLKTCSFVNFSYFPIHSLCTSRTQGGGYGSTT